MNPRRTRRLGVQPPVDSASAATLPTNEPLFGSAIAAVIGLCVYLIQAPHVSGDKDASEFTLVLGLNGVAHPTGYPLYTLLGHGFVSLMRGLGASWAYAANAWSAIGGAVALFFLHALSMRLIPPTVHLSRRGRFLLALVPWAMFGFNPMWTVEATVAEVYSWHLAWLCGTCWCFAGFMRALTRERCEPARVQRAALIWGFLCGLGLAHHLTSLLVFPPLSISLALAAHRTRRLRGRDVGTCLVMVLLPLASYAIIAVRAFHPTQVQWFLLAPSWSSIRDHLIGAQYHGGLGQFTPSEEQREYLASYIYPFLFPGLASLWFVAVRAKARELRLTLGALATAASLGTVHGFTYGVPDPASYFLAPMALGLVSVAMIAAPMLASAARRRRGIAGVAVVAIALMALLASWTKVAETRRRVYENFEDLVHAMWRSIPFEEAIVLWNNDMYLRLREYQWLQGEKPGIAVHNSWELAGIQVRARFSSRFGFDPYAGVALVMGPDGRLRGGDRAVQILFEELAESLNAKTGLPVILFDPQQQSVRLLKKPGVPAPQARSPTPAPASDTKPNLPEPDSTVLRPQ